MNSILTAKLEALRRQLDEAMPSVGWDGKPLSPSAKLFYRFMEFAQQAEGELPDFIEKAKARLKKGAHQDDPSGSVKKDLAFLEDLLAFIKKHKYYVHP